MCAEPSGLGLQLIVQVVSERIAGKFVTGVSWNGAWPIFDWRETDELLFPAGPYAKHIEEHCARNYLLGVESIRDGWNEIVLCNESPDGVPIVGLELGIRRQADGMRKS